MANSEQVTARIDTIEALLVERYNAPLDGDLYEAVVGLRSSADDESIARFASLMEGRELYRWREPVDAAFAALRDGAGVAETEKKAVRASRTDR